MLCISVSMATLFQIFRNGVVIAGFIFLAMATPFKARKVLSYRQKLLLVEVYVESRLARLAASVIRIKIDSQVYWSELECE